MKLKSARVTNFRSVEDSGEFQLDQVTCLVGKNEAGKTAILTALAGFEPHESAPIAYEIERDYPRRHLNDYKKRHPDEHAIVVTTTWELDDDEVAEVEAILGAGALDSRVVSGVRRYEAAEPEWNGDLAYQTIIDRFIVEANLSASERSQIGSPSNSQELKAAIAGIDAPTEKHSAILARLNALPGGYILGVLREVASRHSPYMMYFSHYDRMVGEVRLDTLQTRIDGNPPPVLAGERVFLDFLHFAGTSLEEINATQTYESLNARCESASIKITDQLLEYWRQNPNLSIEVRVTKGEPDDPAPFNKGIVARARVRNDLYRMSVPFSERSAGFIWFFSFLVKFAQVESDEPVMLILDEPGLTLHGTAQADLLRYFDDKLAPEHQVVFSTHSPFMVPADKLQTVRIVEDRLFQKRPNVWDSEGTKVRDDTLTVDRDTLFPLQGALGYDLTQSLFVGKHTILVEGPSDILYLQVMSDALGRRKREVLDANWTICPTGGIDKIQSFVGLFSGNNLHVAAITDYAKGDRKKIEAIKARNVLETDHLLTYATVLGLEEADVEDIFPLGLYANFLNATYSLKKNDILTLDKLDQADQNTTRAVKKAEAAMRLVSAGVPEFNHFDPSAWLLRNPQILDTDDADVVTALDNAEKIIKALNVLMKKS